MMLADLGDPPAGANVFDWILEAAERARIARQAAWLLGSYPTLSDGRNAADVAQGKCKLAPTSAYR